MTSTLLRCIHSVYNRTPKQLLHEIVLVNDKSSFGELYGDLHLYVEKMFFDGRVKIVENEERQGLIKARMTGAKAATGEVLVFLDSHMEVYNGWIPPLLGKLMNNEFEFDENIYFFQMFWSTIPMLELFLPPMEWMRKTSSRPTLDMVIAVYSIGTFVINGCHCDRKT